MTPREAKNNGFYFASLFSRRVMNPAVTENDVVSRYTIPLNDAPRVASRIPKVFFIQASFPPFGIRIKGNGSLVGIP